MKKAGSATSLPQGTLSADVLTEIRRGEAEEIQNDFHPRGGWQAATDATGHQGSKLRTTQDSQKPSAHIPASLRDGSNPPPHTHPFLQQVSWEPSRGLPHQPWDHPHLWFLLGSPCGAERPPAFQGLPHPLRALSRLETTKNHLWGGGQDELCQASHFASCAGAVQGGGGRGGLSRMQRSHTTKQAQSCPS